MKKIQNKDIAEYLEKQINTINSYKSRNPKLLELLKLGMLCKKNNLSETDIQKLLELKESFLSDSDTKLLK